MRSFLLMLAILAAGSTAYAAPEVTFPYETVVEADETYVRSGPGSKFYPTAKLRRGDKVVVHRHDPGGWYMIAPPPGSFSWVRAKHVQKSAPDRGTITADNVAVRVGSFESNIREVLQRTLARGDEIRILDDKLLPPETGSGPAEPWYRIEPPRGEWRWITGQAVAPAPRRGNRGAADDPFEMNAAAERTKRSSPPAPRADTESPAFEKPAGDPSNREYLDDAAPHGNGDTPLVTRPLVRKEKKSDVKSASRNADAILNELDRLDARFRSILDQPVLAWDFGQLERDYQLLREETDSSNVQQMIDARLRRIAGYRKTRGEEEELARIQNETSRRDAELADLQRRQEAQLASLQQRRFDGAGIVERAAINRRGAPRYALLAPAVDASHGGRVLAYLVPAAGVNLEGWVGRAVGVVGSRVHHPELKADLITVSRLVPVRLVP